MEGESSCRPAKCKPHDALRSPMEITLQGTTEGDPYRFLHASVPRILAVSKSLQPWSNEESMKTRHKHIPQE